MTARKPDGRDATPQARGLTRAPAPLRVQSVHQQPLPPMTPRVPNVGLQETGPVNAADPGPMATALAHEGAMLVTEAPWSPPRRHGIPASKVIRFVSRYEFFYDGVPFPIGAIFPRATCEHAGERRLRQLVQASMLRVEVLLVYTLEG